MGEMGVEEMVALVVSGGGRRRVTGDGSRVSYNVGMIAWREVAPSAVREVCWLWVGVIGCRVFPARGEEFERYMVPAGWPRSRSSYRGLLVRPKSAARRIVFPSPPKPARAHAEPYVR